MKVWLCFLISLLETKRGGEFLKTKFSNAEKVSDNYIATKFEEIKNRFVNFEKVGSSFISERFLKMLENISKSTLDNYEKLKKFLELETNFEEYITSKQFLFEVIEFSLGVSFYDANYSDWFLELINSPKEKLGQPSKRFNGISIFEYLDKKYLPPREKEVSFAGIIKKLNAEDIKKIESIVVQHYKTKFLEIYNSKVEFMLNKELLFEDAVFVSRAFMEAYFELFKYGEEDEFACKFKDLLIKATTDSMALWNLAIDSRFWKLLFEFSDFHDHRLCSFINYMNGLATLEESDSQTKLIKPSRKVLDLALETKILANFDLQDFDLSDKELKKFTIINCNLNGTKANIDFSTLNKIVSLCFVQGEKIDITDLTKSCFKGCIISGLSSEILKLFKISVNTFDKEVLEEYGIVFEGFKSDTNEKQNIGTLLDNLSLNKTDSNYTALKGIAEFEWVLILKELFPYNTLFY